MKHIFFAAPVFALCATGSAAVLFADDFSTDRSTTDYAVFKSLTDATATFAYDYSGDMTGDAGTSSPAASIPSAPGATDKKALKVEVNPTAAVAQAITIYPSAVVAAGTDFTLSFNVFARVPAGTADSYTGGAGSTQSYVAGIHHAGDKVINPRQSGTTGLPAVSDGYFWAGSSEGGYSDTSTLLSDYALLEGNTAAASDKAANVTWGSAATAEADAMKGNVEPLFTSLYSPAAGYYYFATNGGAFGDHWTTVKINYTAATNTVQVRLDDTLVATYVDGDGTFATGKVSIGVTDAFNSASGAGLNYFLFDNLLVESQAASVDEWSAYE